MTPLVHRLTKKNLEAVAALDKQMRAERSWDDRVVDWTTQRVGSKRFVYCNAIFFLAWVALNGRSGSHLPLPDPFPFPLLSLVVSIEVFFLSMFILLTQGRQSAVAERRSHLELQLILLSEQENTVQLELLRTICKKLAIPVQDIPEEMLKETEPSVLLGHLDEVFDEHDLQIPGSFS